MVVVLIRGVLSVIVDDLDVVRPGDLAGFLASVPIDVYWPSWGSRRIVGDEGFHACDLRNVYAFSLR
jgi:hypothetical protein